MTNTALCARAGGGGEEGKGISSLGAAGARHHKRKPCLSVTLRDTGPSVRHLQQLKDGSVGGWEVVYQGPRFLACHTEPGGIAAGDSEGYTA